MASGAGTSCSPAFGWVPQCFLLEPAELGCTHSTKHTIKVTDDTPFKEWFRQIPPPLVEEVQSHLREMLESGAIQPSQSAWCNAIVLVRKKDGGLWFCINFSCLNAHTKLGLLPPAENSGGIGESGRCWNFSCLDLKLGFWQIKMEEASKHYTAFTVDNLGFSNATACPLGCAMHQPCFRDWCKIVLVS